MAIAQPSNSRIRLVGEAAWVALGQILSAAGLLLGLRLLTEYLDPKAFAHVGLSLGIAALGTSLFCGPILQAASRYYPEAAHQSNVHVLRDIIVYYVTRSTFALIALIVAVGSLASALLDISWWMVPSVAALIAIDTARSLEVTLMAAARWQKPPALWNATEALARPLIAVAFMHVLGTSPQVVLFAFFVTSLAIYAAFHCTFVQRMPYGKDPKKTPEIAVRSSLSREIKKYAIPMVPVAFVAWINSLSDRYVIAALLGLAQSGIYMAAYGLVSRPYLMVGGLILQTLRPVYYEAVSRGEEQRALRIARLMLHSMAATCTAGCVLVLFLKEPIGRILLGPSFRSGIDLLPWLALGYTFLCLSYVSTTTSLAYKRSSAVSVAELAGACCSLIVGIPLIWVFGLEGAAVAVPVYYLAQLVTARALAKRDSARYWCRQTANADSSALK